MDKLTLIIQREYLTRVRKKSFIVMTILGPILLAAMIIVPIWLTSLEDEDTKIIAVIDNPKDNFKETLIDSKSIKFQYPKDANIENIQGNFEKLDYYAVLYNSDTGNYSPDSITLSSNKQPSINVKIYISKAIEKRLEKEKLQALGVDEDILQKVKTNVDIKTLKWSEDGKVEETSTEVIMGIGFTAAIIIYMFIFIYGSQVMRGVIEEKANRIVEVIISSVKPLPLMMGKIIGVALVALTQFLLWIILTAAILSYANSTFLADKLENSSELTEKLIQDDITGQSKNIAEISKNQNIDNVLKTLNNLPWIAIVGNFMFFFLGGYLLYTSLFAAIGSAVDNEADTQQFMLPVTIPLILAFVLAQPVIQNPEGPLAFWFSMIPFTSPIIMMVRIPFGVPVWEMLLSMFFLIITFIATTWLAAKIYRVGILMYGKKINYKELWKWIKYQN